LQIINEINENKWHDLREAGSYEWWYFDGIDNNKEYSFVTIFFAGNPFSPEYNIQTYNYLKFPESKKPDVQNFCAVSFNLYKKGKVLYRVLFEYQKNKFTVKNVNGADTFYFDKSSFYFDESAGTYHLNIYLSAPVNKNKFKAEFIFSVLSDASSVSKTPENQNIHYWLPAAAVCKVNGKFKFYKNFKRKKTEFHGLGYHDHNWGRESLFQNIMDWYWGRIISGEYSIVYFYIIYKENQKAPFKKLLIFKNGELFAQKDDFKIRLKHKKNYWLLNYNRKIVIEADQFKLIGKNQTKIDNGPFYIRFLTKIDFYVEGKIALKMQLDFLSILILKD